MTSDGSSPEFTFAAIYGMLLVKRETGNAWGCVAAFLLIWNAL